MSLDIKDANNITRTIATSELNAAHVQQIGWSMSTRDDTYTTTTTGTTVDVSTLGMSCFGLQVKESGTVTSWTVEFQVSLNGTNFVTVMTHTKATNGNGAIAFTGVTKFPGKYFRSNCTALVLGGGTNIIATIIGMP